MFQSKSGHGLYLLFLKEASFCDSDLVDETLLWQYYRLEEDWNKEQLTNKENFCSTIFNHRKFYLFLSLLPMTAEVEGQVSDKVFAA